MDFGRSCLKDSASSVAVEAKLPAAVAVADSVAETVAEALPTGCFVREEMPTIDFASRHSDLDSAGPVAIGLAVVPAKKAAEKRMQRRPERIGFATCLPDRANLANYCQLLGSLAIAPDSGEG